MLLSMATMVVQVRRPSGWPVSLEAGTANPVWAATQEICSSGGSKIFTLRKSSYEYRHSYH
ncbi:ash family protein [Sodalis sp. RH15]|uniref:ash family protein n=1 Tax=Sodalis sp. RH15 TaxID=3394330 RepID=UPI0039B52DD5